MIIAFQNVSPQRTFALFGLSFTISPRLGPSELANVTSSPKGIDHFGEAAPSLPLEEMPADRLPLVGEPHGGPDGKGAFFPAIRHSKFSSVPGPSGEGARGILGGTDIGGCMYRHRCKMFVRFLDAGETLFSAH